MQLPALDVAAKHLVAALRLHTARDLQLSNAPRRRPKETCMHDDPLDVGRFGWHTLLTALALVIRVQSDRPLPAINLQLGKLGK